jgi:hypothetical protein
MAARKTTSKAVANWDEQLAKEAEAAAAMEANVGGGQFFSVRGGILTWNDAPLPNNEMAVIIVDGIMENIYYEEEYDPDNPAPPTCFAFGRDEKTMEPHLIVKEAGQAVSDLCATCEMNEWGTADKGRGKACRNTRRLAMIPAGTLTADGKLDLFDQIEHFESTPLAYMKLSVTSVKGYANFVKQVAQTLRRPPYGIITKVKVVPDPKNQFAILFEPMTNVPDDLMGAIIARNQEAKSVIEFPYQLDTEEAAPKRGARGKAKVAPASRRPAKRSPRKY